MLRAGQRRLAMNNLVRYWALGTISSRTYGSGGCVRSSRRPSIGVAFTPAAWKGCAVVTISKTRVSVATLLVGVWFADSAMARDLVGTRATGMGGRLVASAAGVAAPLVNPAGMSAARTYAVSAAYQYRGSDSANMLNAAVVDSVTTRVAAGLYYSFANEKPRQTLALAGGSYTLDLSRQTHEIGVALSMGLGKRIMLGVATRYINSQAALPDDAPSELSLADANTVTIDAGAIVRVIDGLNFGIVGYNLVPADDQLYPIGLGFGVSYTMGTLLTAEFASVLDFDSDPDGITATLHGGAELFLAKKFPFRAGVMHSLYREATFLSGGIGWISRRLGIEVSLRQQIAGGADTLVAAALQLFVL